jgi:hypothetical protein
MQRFQFSGKSADQFRVPDRGAVNPSLSGDGSACMWMMFNWTTCHRHREAFLHTTGEGQDERVWINRDFL